MPVAKLKAFLDSNQVHYQCIPHPVAYTAQGTAALAHLPGRELAKTVMVRIDGALAMAVLPASAHVDLVRLRRGVGARDASLVPEAEFRDRFPDCEVGAMPPFGNLYGMRVFVDESLAADKEIGFNAGSHRELIRLSYEDFVRLVKPMVLQFAASLDMESVGAWHL